MGGRAIPDNARHIGLFLRARPLAVFSWWSESRGQQQICRGADDDESHDEHWHPIGHFPLPSSKPTEGTDTDP
jgi:hypothetical protein